MQVFSIFNDLRISVDSVATSEVSVSLTLDPKKLPCDDAIHEESVRLFHLRLTFYLCKSLVFVSQIHFMT